MQEKLLEDLINDGNVYLRPKDKPTYREQTLLKQSFKCACCGKDLSEHKNTNRHVDHDHKSKLVRGVLCATCNLVLGKIERAGYGVEWLQQLTDYLNSSKTNVVYPEKITARRKTKQTHMRELLKENAWCPDDKEPLCQNKNESKNSTIKENTSS